MTAAVAVAVPAAVVVSVGVPAAVHGLLGDLGRRPGRHLGIFHHLEGFVRVPAFTMIGHARLPARLPSLIRSPTYFPRPQPCAN